MYEEIIQRLRETSMDFGEADHVSVMLLEAADVIEEEDANFRHLERDYKELCAHLPKWIPVTERLPEESEGLNWGEEPTLRFTSVWCCDVNTGSIEVRNRLQGKKTGIECLDEYTKDTKWHWSHSWWEPTHWMPIVPLPEKPKEL